MVLLTFTPLLPRALEFIGLADYVPAIQYGVYYCWLHL
jgi:hypothetical protein